MRQSNNTGNRDKTIALYLRISREDSRDDESYSVANQRKLLSEAAKKMGFTNLMYFVDDGITGTSRDRKEFTRMIDELKRGHISTVIVKDLSRLARDHIQADILIEETFPKHDIRLIALSEGLDTANGEDEFTPFRNLMNEWYARDISKKRKLTNQVKGNAGEPLSPPPYGYTKDPENSKRWIVDPEAAKVVKRIFELTVAGKGTEQIASMLSCDKVLTPLHYWQSKGMPRPGKTGASPHRWNSSTIVSIVGRQEYVGDIINFKTYSKSFKLKKRIPNAVENMAVFKDVHEPIIERDTFERIQQKRGTRRRRKTNTGEKSMFSGFLVCADCGHNLWYHFNQKNPDIKYFNCSGYNTRKANCETTHYIRCDFLERVVLQEIRRLTRFARQYEAEFANIIRAHHDISRTQLLDQKRKELSAMKYRDKEIDGLYAKMYEDNVSGKLDDERFVKMSNNYTLEQKKLSERIRQLSFEIEQNETKAMCADKFLSTVRRYTRAKKLTEQMLGELVDKIEVHQKTRVDGKWQQRLTIHYNFIGVVSIPEILAMPEVVTQTRKGVQVSYSTLQKVV